MSSRGILAALVFALVAVVGNASPSQAAFAPVRFKMDAKTYAKKIGCKHAYYPGGSPGAKRFHIKNSVVCWLRSKRVNVITFKDYTGQQRWENFLVDAPLNDRIYWASAHGVVIISKNGTRSAACVGYRAVKGNVDAHAFWSDGYDRGWGYVDC
jgi:hypothetical protein